MKAFLDKAAADGDKIGAFLLEPLMLGAGGLKFIDPLFQSVAVRECKSRGMPVVYDEVSGDLLISMINYQSSMTYSMVISLRHPLFGLK